MITVFFTSMCKYEEAMVYNISRKTPGMWINLALFLDNDSINLNL